MQQFFVETLSAPYLSQDQWNQCKKVLRMRKGDQIRIVDNNGRGILAEFNNDDLTEIVEVESLEWKPKKRTLRLIASLIRSERLEWMIQKACECGVDEIVLYSADHGVVRDFGKRADRKLERLNLIAKEASEQSYRQHAIKVVNLIGKPEIKEYLSDLNVFADIGDQPHLLTVLTDEVSSVTAIVGPEGGFSLKERDYFKDIGFKEVSLGHNVLRAETASLYIANMLSAAEVI
ncbi:RsmE family RNA methyltransferase [Erysipelothrix aquatica]|uniref:RsmE family RNA methyltransferase n=1 Tax=Erysipelothrix aquatica TaxID=2683714 RepID=UPI00135CAF29|nr:RsmE family RNA methyltransferase [Erysipelothrix aquatica]